jgi:hypothetical protein
MKESLLALLLFGSFSVAFAQPSEVSSVDAADPGVMRSRFTLDAESYLFYSSTQFYAFRLGYQYGLQNGKHLFGLSVPFVHNVFNEDLAGYENTSGIGDIKMNYMAAISSGHSLGWTRVSPYLEVTAPTGEFILGRGAGTWVYKPGILFTYSPDPAIAFYPEVRYQFSADDANSSGDTGTPDPEDPELDKPIRNLTIQLPVVLQLNNAQSWVSLNAWYSQSFSWDEYYLYIRTDVGTMLGNKTSAALHLSKFIAGQPRLNVIVQAKFLFFL